MTELDSASPSTAGNRTERTGWSASWLAEQGPLTPPMLGQIAVVLGVLLMPLVFFRFQRDQMHFAYLAWAWLNGLAPYADLPSHQFPGQHMLFAGIFKLLGVSEIAVRLVDWLLYVAAGVALAGIVSRLTRPLTGFFAAILFVLNYVCLGTWNTTNRETFQIVLLLPILYWLLFGTLRPWVDKLAAFASGVALMLMLLIKPTVGLALLPLAWMVFSPGTDAAPPKAWRHRWPLLLLGGAALAALCAGLFFAQRREVFESLLTYNSQIYAKIPYTGSGRFAPLVDFAYKGLCCVPFIFLIWDKPQRPILVRLLAIHAGLIAAVLVQGRGFDYQTWPAVPLCLLWTVLFVDRVVKHTFTVCQAANERRLRILASASVLLLAIGIPYGNRRMLTLYWAVIADPTNVDGPLPPIWDGTIEWMRDHVEPQERVFFFGHDVGVPFLMRIPPVTRSVTGVLDLRNVALNTHPLMLRLKDRMMTDLEVAPPDLIFVATYDATWLSRSGLESLPAFPAFQRFLRTRYDRVEPDPAGYAVFRRRRVQ